MYSGLPSFRATVACWFSSMKSLASPTTSVGMGSWSKLVTSMKMKESPSWYRYCISRRSTSADSILVSELKVRSTVLPLSTCLSLVRTTVLPLPGLWCWNQMTVQS